MAEPSIALSVAVPRLAAAALFIVVLLGFIVETQLTQYVQSTLGYRQPFFLFYIVHSTFTLIFPLHYLYLLATAKYTHQGLKAGLITAMSRQVSGKLVVPHALRDPSFPIYRFLVFSAILTVGYNLPGMLWFAAVSLAPVTDVTAIWNANAFFAYLLSVKLLHLSWDRRRLGAVFLATLGVLAVVYGGTTASPRDSFVSGEAFGHPSSPQPTAPFLGDMLTLVASFVYGLYQVLYKKYATIPSDPELVAEGSYYQHLPESESIVVDEINDTPLSTKQEGDFPPPFGLHPNLLTGVMGLITLFTFWIPVVLLDYFGIEKFALPADLHTTAAIMGIALSGMAFSAGFMILLGLWGPIITSVGNLLTIVLVLISDTVFGLAAITPWSLTGAGMIVAAFAVLVYTMYEI